MSAPDPYLAELADMAMDLARDMHRRAKAATDNARLLDHRKAQLKSAVGLAIDEQQPGLAQAVRLKRELSERLEHDRLFDILSQGAVEDHIARLSQRLGLYLPCPAEDGGGGPLAERSEERVVEGASRAHSASPAPCCDDDAVISIHEPHERDPAPVAADSS